jgi:hypothetical protein
MREQKFLNEQVQGEIVNARLKDVMNEFGADTDVVTLLKVIVDAWDGELTSGDIAAVYCYRMAAQAKQ